MLEIVKAGGWVMFPIIVCSVTAIAIILERLWTLQEKRVLPRHLTKEVWEWVSTNQLNHENLKALHDSSPLGEILAVGLTNRHRNREIMKERIEDTGRHVAHASISPLLGLLGTVSGMINLFETITTQGVGNPMALSGGISEALITTEAGLLVAIPALVAYRYLRGRVAALIVRMEQEAITLVEALHRKRYLDALGQNDEAA
jgi:biopolymer transport protein ExbB